jgi:hypothetical protein
MPSARTELQGVPRWDKTRWHQMRIRWRNRRNGRDVGAGRLGIKGVEVIGGVTAASASLLGWTSAAAGPLGGGICA